MVTARGRGRQRRVHRERHGRTMCIRTTAPEGRHSNLTQLTLLRPADEAFHDLIRRTGFGFFLSSAGGWIDPIGSLGAAVTNRTQTALCIYWYLYFALFSKFWQMNIRIIHNDTTGRDTSSGYLLASNQFILRPSQVSTRLEALACVRFGPNNMHLDDDLLRSLFQE